MDRNKSGSSGRPSKSKVGAPHHGSELFALGSKSSSDAKSKVMSSSSKTIVDRKREHSSSSHGSSSVVSKKPKLTSSLSTGSGSSSSNVNRLLDSTLSSSGAGGIGSIGGNGGIGSSTSQQLEYWEQCATDCETVELISSVLAAIDLQDSDKVIALICGAIKLAVNPRAKPEPMLSLSLLYLGKIRPHLFCNETITSALLSVLKRDVNHAFKGRNNPTIHVLAANLLARGYHNKVQWPEMFVRVYIDDAINERVWVDYEDCSSFVENICTAFGTRIPPKSMLQPELSALTQTSREGLGTDDDSTEAATGSDTFRSGDSTNLDCPTQPRYLHMPIIIEKLVLDSVKDLLNRRQAPDSSTRNLLRFLSATSGISEVRVLASYGGRLEHWMHNGKLMKPAQELLTYICYNVTGQTTRDHEVLANLVKMRLKTKPIINIYMSCLKEMINLQPSILNIVLKYVVQNELSPVRNPNNMGMLASMFQAKQEESAQYLADIYQEFLMQREDCLRTLRVFLRELVKMLRFDIKLTVFCKRLLTTSKALATQLETVDYRDRVFYSIVDLVCLCMFLSVSPQIKEANVSLRSGREIKGSKVLIDFYEQMSQIQCDALKWMMDTVPEMFKPTDVEYTQSLHKILFLDAPEQYSKADQWPPEQERSLLMRLVSEIPLLQDSILCIILIGINKDNPFKVPDTVETLEQVIRRAAGLKIIDYPVLEANKLEVIDFLFSMAEYHHPENIALPMGYEPPKLAISSLYWKAWNILLMLSAHNPATFGAFCWDQYPMLRNLMEMCITNQFTESKLPEEELQVATLERTQILEFETHLAAATSKVIITEQNSLLLSQLMLMDPMGVARRPPMHILEQFQVQNGTHKLGHLLCRSRKPDLLLDIIQRQGSSQSMPWLADLVQNSEGEFNHLPVQCLCEFLLSNSNNICLDNSRDIELLAYLQKLLIDDSGNHKSLEVLEYFLRRLSATNKQSRQLAIIGLRLLLKVFHTKTDENEIEFQESDWLLRYLPMMPYFMTVRLIVIVQLRAACQIENNPDLVMIYIQFIAANTLHDLVPDMLDHVMDMSQLIVERSTVFSCIIPGSEDSNDECRLQTLNCLFVMFNNYLIKLREHKTPYTWPEYSDLLMVHFTDGSQLPIHLNIIQAFVILLTYSSMIPNSQPILDYWFPPGAMPPLAYTIENNEQVQILPDWLKLKMIRSSVDRLVDAALIELTPDQIVLFVQNFGTPVNSMSKLLALLDRAVIEQFDIVKQAILNKEYLAQLIEIQQTRGAKNGHIAMQSLEMQQLSKSSSDPSSTMLISRQSLIHIDFNSPSDMRQPMSRTKEIEDVIDLVLAPQPLAKANYLRFRTLMQQLIAKDISNRRISSRQQSMYGTATNMQQYASGKVLQYLHRLATGPHGQFVFRNLFQKSSVCSLFRSLLTWQPDKLDALGYLVQVMDECIKNLNPSTNSVLCQMLLNKRKMYLKTDKDSNQIEKKEFIEVLQTSPMMELEKQGKNVLNELFKQADSGYLVDAITTSLESTKEDSIPNEKIGLLVDWLANIDSELVVSTRVHQLDLLFSTSVQQFRFYLLSLLSHQASWNTLHSTLRKLLQEFNPTYDPSSVLHFIETLMCNPKLWQGRDKATPKHDQIEYVINMSTKQIQVFTDYILCECATMDPEKINFRVQVLLKCVRPGRLNLKKLIIHVKEHPTANADIRLRFLQQLYMNMPTMKFCVADLDDVYTANAKQLRGCEADIISNYTLTAISSFSAKENQQMTADMELIVRKLAASHPALILRQLSVIASLLQGRAHMDLHVLRNKSLVLFNQVLGILELLQPHVFEEFYQSGLHQALDCYFTLLRHHGRAKDTYLLMYRFMELLQAYTNKSASRALNFIEQYAELMQDLAMDNRNIIPLQQLVQGVSMLKHRHKHDFTNVERSEDISHDEDIKPSTSNIVAEQASTSIKEETDSSGAAAVILAPYLKQSLTPPHWPQLIKTVLRRNGGEEILASLQEIEIITHKRQGLLDPIFERILELLQSPLTAIRHIAHILLVRHLKYCPGNATTNAKALNSYCQCLRDADPLIVNSALETLTEIVICLQEYAAEILKTVFDLGINSKQNTFEPLRQCLLALKTQHAC